MAQQPGRVDAALRFLSALVLVVGLGLIGWGFLPGDGDGDARAASSGYVSMRPAKPVRLAVPSLGIRAPIVPIEVTPDGTLPPPEDGAVVGWWQRSAKPGATKGQTVVTGHTLSAGDGALDPLLDVKPGATIDLRTKRGAMRYRVQRVRVWSYAEVAERAAHLFAQDRQRGRLVLVTCTDFDGSVYRSNVVVFARPLGRPARG